MRNVELFIGNTRVDFFKDESISLNDSINNVKDISKVFTPFTQSFNVPASSTNNLLFKHYYKFDIDNGFDARFKADAILKLNGADFKKGGVILNGVDLRENKPRSYKITFFGELSKLKDILGNAELSALTDLFQYKFIAQGTGDDTLRMFENGITTSGVASTNLENTNVIFPLITLKDYFQFDNTNTITTPNFHNVSLFLDLKAQLKPAIKIKRIIEAINNQFDVQIQTADIGSKTSFFGSDVFNELYLWCHRENTPTSPEETIPPTFGLNFDKVLEVKTLADLTYTGGDPDPLSGGTLTINQGDLFTIRWNVAKTTATPVLMQLSAVDKNTGELLFIDEKAITNVATTMALKDLSAGQLDQRTYDIEFKFQAESPVTLVGGIGAISKNAVTLSNYSYTGFPLRNYGLIEDLIPKMKIIDFLAGLFRTFNLVAYTEGNSSQIFVQTFDDFMNGGTVRDITEFVDVNKSKIERPVPYSRIEYQYAPAKDQMSKRYIDAFGRQFGNLDYNAPERFDGSNFFLKSPFAHFIYINIKDVNSTFGFMDYPMGWCIDEKGEKPVLPAPLIFFRNNIDTSAEPVTGSNLNSYNAPSNVSTDGNHTINFGNEQNEITKEMVTNGIFDRFWRQFIVQSFALKGRIIKITAYLNNDFLINYKLNDVIRIAGRDYYINSIKTNLTTGKSELELIVKTVTYQPSVLT